MTFLSEALNLYRNDPHVDDALFARLIQDAIELDAMQNDAADCTPLFSRHVDAIEFDALVREAEAQ